jgi:hypothetical protein
MKSTNFVHELDKQTGNVVNAILTAQDIATAGDYLTLPNATKKVWHTSIRFGMCCAVLW